MVKSLINIDSCFWSRNLVEKSDELLKKLLYFFVYLIYKTNFKNDDLVQINEKIKIFNSLSLTSQTDTETIRRLYLVFLDIIHKMHIKIYHNALRVMQ